jgi:hypothetical protein
MLLLLTLLPQAITDKNFSLIIGLPIGLALCMIALFLNWRGLVKAAGILTLAAMYTEGTLILLHYPNGLTINDLYLLDLTIIPNVLVLAFFSANSLIPILGMNVVQVWAVLNYGPHEGAVTHLLQAAPLQIFANVYALQLITAIFLYLWCRSTEHALARAIRAEERAAFERHEKEFQERELEQKRQLDAGIQQILQTHVAVANGDLNARAPLMKDHDLWQVANALNNLIARFQNYAEYELQQQITGEHRRVTKKFSEYRQNTRPIPRQTLHQ